MNMNANRYFYDHKKVHLLALGWDLNLSYLSFLWEF